MLHNAASQAPPTPPPWGVKGVKKMMIIRRKGNEIGRWGDRGFCNSTVYSAVFVTFRILHLGRRLLWVAQVSPWSSSFCSSCFAGRLISRASRVCFYPSPTRHLWRVCPGFGAWCLDGNSLTLSGDWLITIGLVQPNKFSWRLAFFQPFLALFAFCYPASPPFDFLLLFFLCILSCAF